MNFPVFIRSRRCAAPSQPTDPAESLVAICRKRGRTSTDIRTVGLSAESSVPVAPLGVLATLVSFSRGGWCSVPRRSATTFTAALSMVVQSSVAPMAEAPPTPGFLLDSCTVTPSFRNGIVDDARKVLQSTREAGPLSEVVVPWVLSGGNTVVVAPRGCGEVGVCMFCAGCAALSLRQSLPYSAAPACPTVLVLAGSTEELRRCRRELQQQYGRHVVIGGEVGQPREKEGGANGVVFEGDVLLFSLFGIADAISDAERSAYSLDLGDVRLLVVLGADRICVPPLADRLAPEFWDHLRRQCHPDVQTVVCGAIGTRVHASAELVISETRMHNHAVPPLTVRLLDCTAFLDVYHEVASCDASLATAYIREMFAAAERETPAIVVVLNKREAEQVSSDLCSSGVAATTNWKSFREGEGDVMVLSEWQVLDLHGIPSSVGLVVNVGVPRRDLEESLALRARTLFGTASRAFVCHMVTLVDLSRTHVSVMLRLRQLLEETKQFTPPFLRSIPERLLGEERRRKPR